jgi:hypothetical protein
MLGGRRGSAEDIFLLSSRLAVNDFTLHALQATNKT